MNEQAKGPPIRVLVAKPGLDGHDVGAKLVCRALRDAGMEVIYTGLRQSPRAVARSAIQEGVDVVGLSVLSGAHVPLCRKVKHEFVEHGLRNVVLLVGGNVPRKDQQTLLDLGVHAVFPTGAPFEAIVSFIREKVGR
jgi:methylmalonyl-CoA mutase C-terminal domain/subunit